MTQKYMSVAIAALFATAGTVYAQQTPAPKPASAASAEKADDGKVESIVVTARRRDELLQDVPGAVTAIGGAFLEKSGIPDVTALADIVPNTTLKASRATNTTLTAFIRGIGQQDPLPGFEQGVGIYLDDIYLSRPQGALTDIYDLERIEVFLESFAGRLARIDCAAQFAGRAHAATAFARLRTHWRVSPGDRLLIHWRCREAPP